MFIQKFTDDDVLAKVDELLKWYENNNITTELCNFFTVAKPNDFSFSVDAHEFRTQAIRTA